MLVKSVDVIEQTITLKPHEKVGSKKRKLTKRKRRKTRRKK
jgi:hypothetical protein